jgi:hypothetical protein
MGGKLKPKEDHLYQITYLVTGEAETYNTSFVCLQNPWF